MSSKVADIAKAVHGMIDDAEAADFTLDFTLRRLYLPKSSLEELSALTLTVFARSDTSSPFSRAGPQREIKIDIAAQKKLTNDPAVESAAMLAELDGLMEFMEELADFFPQGTAIPGVAGAFIRPVTNEPIYDPTHLNELKVFSSLITLTVIVYP
jgi:hypothetical protein